MKIRCRECYWNGTTENLLTAPSPFLEGVTITACPKCKSIDCFENLCDIKDCINLVDVGLPTEEGYKFLCHKHHSLLYDNR